MTNRTHGGSWSRRRGVRHLGARGNEASRIHDRYHHVIVDARNVSRVRDEVDVAAFDTLLRLSTAAGANVQRLADPWNGADVFFVDDGGVRYRYRTAGRPIRRRLVTV